MIIKKNTCRGRLRKQVKRIPFFQLKGAPFLSLHIKLFCIVFPPGSPCFSPKMCWKWQFRVSKTGLSGMFCHKFPEYNWTGYFNKWTVHWRCRIYSWLSSRVYKSCDWTQYPLMFLKSRNQSQYNGKSVYLFKCKTNEPTRTLPKV